MKIFKWIYYPILIVAFVLMTALGFDGAYSAESKTLLGDEARAKVNEHIEKIADYGSHNAGQASALSDVATYIRSSIRTENKVQLRSDDAPDADGLNTAATYATTSADGVRTPLPTIVKQRAVLLPSTMANMEGGTMYVDRTVENLVVAIPGSKTVAKYNSPDDESLSYGDAVLFTAHYDSSTLSAGAADNTAAVASMIEVIKEVARRETPYANDLVFVFTAGGEEGALGAYAFRYQFKGFDDIYSRVKVAFSFDAQGGSGTLVMSELSSDGSALVSAFASIAGGTRTGSLYSSLFENEKTDDFDAFGDVTRLGFTTLRDTYAGTSYDTPDNLSPELVTAMGNMQLRAVRYFGDKDLSAFTGGSSAGFFNYLGGTVWYAGYVAYIIAGLIILLAAVNIVLAVRKKTFSLGAALLGIVVDLLAIAATLCGLYVAYTVTALILTGFEVIDIHAIGSAVYCNAGMLVFALTLGFALSVIFYSVFKKVFAVRASDVVRGNTLLVSLLAVVFGFAVPAQSYIFFTVALLWQVVMLVVSLVKDKFKAKFGFDIERLFLYAIPAILLLPVLCGELVLASSAAPVVILPLLAVVFLLYGGSIMPYADYLARPLGDMVAALPPRTARVKREVVEMREDPAKKGKFNEVKVIKTFKEKKALSYRNAYGITVVSVISAVAIILFSAFGGGFGRNITMYPSHYDEVYKDALVYVWDDGNESMQVSDLDAYKYIARYVDGFDWNSDLGAYVKTAGLGLVNIPVHPAVSADSENSRKFTVSMLDGSDINNSTFTVRLSGFGAGNIDLVRFTSVTGAETEFDLSADESESFTFVLPYGYDSGFSFEIEGDAAAVTVDLEQRGTDPQFANENSVFSLLQEMYSLDTEISSRLRMSIVIHTSASFNL